MVKTAGWLPEPAGSAATVVDLIPGHTTSVTAVFALDVGPREVRTMPSLHLFDRRELDPEA